MKQWTPYSSSYECNIQWLPTLPMGCLSFSFLNVIHLDISILRRVLWDVGLYSSVIRGTHRIEACTKIQSPGLPAQQTRRHFELPLHELAVRIAPPVVDTHCFRFPVGPVLLDGGVNSAKGGHSALLYCGD